MKKSEMQQNSHNSMINWKSFLDDFYQPIVVSDKRGSHLYVNKAACRLTGYSETELMEIGMRGLADPELLKELSQLLKKRLNGDALPFSYDFKIILKDGSKLDVKVNGHKIMWGDQPADLVALYNITTRKKEERWFQVKNQFSLNLNRIFSADLCLQQTCRLIAEEGFYKKSLIVVGNKQNLIVNSANL